MSPASYRRLAKPYTMDSLKAAVEELLNQREGEATVPTVKRHKGEMATMNQALNFADVFSRLERAGSSEETTLMGGVNVRLVRVKGGGEGRWDHHDKTTETVIVWSGDFPVEFRDGVLNLSSGQCCVVPVGAEHRGTSKAGAEVVLFQRAD